MKISQHGWLVWWAYLGVDPWRIPAKTTLCALFWRSVLGTPLKIVGILFVAGLGVLGMFVMPFRQFGWPGLLITPGAVGAIVGIARLVTALGERRSSRFHAVREPSIIRLWYDGVKKRYCPIIEIE